MQKASMWVVLGAILAAVASIAAIIGLPYQMGLLKPSKPGESRQSVMPTSARASQQETDAWYQALANRADCDAVRRYILDYPAGQYVNAAQSILSARRELTKDRWIAFDFPSTVVAASSLDSRADRETACASAREQMMANMTEGCSIFRNQPSRYRSVTVVSSRNANCECQDEAIPIDNQTSNPLWRCSIRATYSCRGEQLQQVKHFVCN